MTDCGVNHDFDLLRGQAEQQVGFDELKPLVHHGSRIDRDLVAHIPVGMGERLLRRNVSHVGQRPVAEGPPRRRQNQSIDGIALARLENLKDGVVL